MKPTITVYAFLRLVSPDDTFVIGFHLQLSFGLCQNYTVSQKRSLHILNISDFINFWCAENLRQKCHPADYTEAYKCWFHWEKALFHRYVHFFVGKMHALG